jgi:hypothetical protein
MVFVSSGFRFPMRSKMDLTSFSAFVLNFEPLIPVFDSSECAKLLLTISDLFVLTNLVIPKSIFKIVANVLNINGELLVVPSGLLASLLADFRLPFELTCLEFNVWVHLAEKIIVVSDISL